MMSEDAQTDAMLERMARVEQEKLDHDHGQHILDLAGTARGRGSAKDLLTDALRRAHQAKAGEE
jgi:uncharacterized protein (UPF0335 family)